MENNTTAQVAKDAGFKSLTELAAYVGVTTQALRNWHQHKPQLFFSIVKGASLLSTSKGRG